MKFVVTTMKRAALLLAMICCLSLTRTSVAEVPIELSFDPQNSDLGNITSDGSGGRQIHVRPLEIEDIGLTWKFYPPHVYFPEEYDPPPPTPAQEDIRLKAGSPLLLVLPQLQHFPSGAAVSVSHTLNGQQLTVDASIHYLGYITRTIYGPHEYLHPIGPLDAGEYRLTLKLATSSVYDSSEPSIATGYLDFVVDPVPEPSAGILVGALALFSVGIGRRKR